ncbi:MAG: hypothetical protein P8J87_16560 [Verrucomicrobiales bacterium]|nr:hypothetical protein [Verrucomicrobiales bacterium]
MNPFHLLLIASLTFTGILNAADVEITAKAVRYDKQGEEQHWGYEIELTNSSKTTITTPVVQ